MHFDNNVVNTFFSRVRKLNLICSILINYSKYPNHRQNKNSQVPLMFYIFFLKNYHIDSLLFTFDKKNFTKQINLSIQNENDRNIYVIFS